MLKKRNCKSILSIVLTICMLATFVPSVFAAQSNEYVDPADNWLPSNNRTNELDVNATITNETQYCNVCKKFTSVLTYRVPEYTKTGETALNRGVRYSDGTCIDGVSKGNLDNGTPGIDAYYTGYHFTKSVCQTCGTINSGDGPTDYDFNNNVYSLNSCDHNFFLDFDATTYEPYDESRHLTTLKRGEYCKFCKGTFARASRGLESHDFTESVDAQLGNNRFYVAEKCDDCGYETSEYVTAKSVVASYYGTADDEAHTLTVSDLSDSGVKTSIRYGDTADSCTKTSAPNYTQAGYYTVYYKINYSYAGETMTENGVSYVWLVNDDETDSNGGNTIIVIPPAHEHEYHYLETVAPSCENLGYERWQCEGCGELQKRNYTPANGHNYRAVTIREATCKQGGLKLWLCSDCGDFYEETTPLASHSYKTVKHNPTCRMTGYTEHICEVCGDNYITDITPIIFHAYEHISTEPTCTSMGFSTFTCADCGDSYVGNYTDMLEHNYNKETVEPTCTEHGYAVYTCPDCGASYTDNYTDKAAHSYEETVTEPTCLELGFSTFVCSACGDTYKSNYREVLGHQPTDWIVDTEATIEHSGEKHIECELCGEILQTAEIAQLIDKDNSDEDGNAQVGNFSIILTDKDGKPVFDSEISIDVNDNVTIKLPEGRLLDFADRTTITAFFTDTQEPAENLRIFIYDTNNNAATGSTDANGQLIVPNNQSSTGDDNGTIGNEDGDKKNTFVVTVTDKTNVVIPNCNIHIGESNNIVVDLPDGIKPTRENPVIVTVTDHNGEAQKDITVIAISDADFMEKGSTDMYGKITLPTASDGYTDENGKVNVDNINVIVNDEIGVIPNSYVLHNEDGTINVTLPAEKTISYANRITVTVLDSVGKPVAEVIVTVIDIAEKSYTANTDENGTRNL